jgi:integrase
LELLQMAIELLQDQKIKSAKPGDKSKRLDDGGGLYLLLKPNGAKWWRFDYSIAGKRKTLSLGVYPAATLANARKVAVAARESVAKGIDPSDTRKASKAAQNMALDAERRIEAGEPAVDSFEEVAREWFSKNLPTWAPTHSDKIIARLQKDVFPWIGGKPIAKISAPDVLSVLRRIEGRGTNDTAHRAKSNCSQIFRYAIATGRAERDPCPDLRGALSPLTHDNFASITDPKAVGELLRAIDGFKGTFVVQCALRLAPLLFVRPGELRKAEWSGFNLDKAEWRYFVTKTKTDQLVPLSDQVVATLRDLHALSGHGRYVFPGRDPKLPMSEAAVNAALRRMGYDTKTEITGHGFRAMARTILHEELHHKPEVIELQLAHKVADALGSAYNRTKFIKERTKMMQEWADYLDKLKAGADVIPLHGSAA